MLNFENHPLYAGDGVPIFIAAGILKEPGQLLSFMQIQDSSVAPVLTLGSFTTPEWAGNAKSGETNFIYYPDTQMAGNAIGLQNPGERGIRAMKEPIRQLGEIGIKTIISITNLPHERPVDVIPQLVARATESNPTAIEINLSCPNGKKDDGTLHAPLCYDADASGEVIEVARREVGTDICIGAKDSPHVQSLADEINEEEIANLARTTRGLLNFITGINTIGNQPFPEITCTGGRGGMSGPVIARLAKRHLQVWQKYSPETAYLSCGGVDTSNVGTEIIERRGLGALLVGGAQEFNRAQQPHQLASRWAQEYVSAIYPEI